MPRRASIGGWGNSARRSFASRSWGAEIAALTFFLRTTEHAFSMRHMPIDPSPIPEAVQSLCALFAEELANVKFPDVDHAVLRDASEQVIAAAEAVARAEAVLLVAREQLAEQQEALLHKSQRALSYAQVFAEENAPLSEKLQQITLPRPPRRQKAAEVAPNASDLVAPQPKRRGRPPKVRADGPGLFQDPTAQAEQAAADA